MIINICFGTRDLARGAAFYDAIAQEMGLARYMETDKAIGWRNPAMGIGLAITLPFDGNEASVGNGTMATIGAANAAQVDRIHAIALTLGGRDEGAPGLRANGFYAAYFRDPDGNKLNAVALG
ncbi:VOC family protein [Acidocella sp.]|uniref:VOC family protein n=1 Tax=Acidocella sp. TaxID=50710 RepID=UPI002603E9FE|nr:VOC family protein [Acidocella sp.]